MKPEPQTDSPLTRALISLLDGTDGMGAYCTTPARLLDALKKHGGEAAKASGFPVNVQRLGMALNAEKAMLKEAGVLAVSKRDKAFGRLWLIGDASEFQSEDELRIHFESDKTRARRLDGLSPD